MKRSLPYVSSDTLHKRSDFISKRYFYLQYVPSGTFGNTSLRALREDRPLRHSVGSRTASSRRSRSDLTPKNMPPACFFNGVTLSGFDSLHRKKHRQGKSLDGVFGALGGIRTPDLLVRSQALYPTELQAHFSSPKYVTTINRKNQPAIPKKIDRPKMLKKTQSSNPAARSISLSVTPKVRRYPATPPYFFSR